MIDKTAFGRRIYDLRNKCGLSQGKLAQMVNVSYQAVSKWENGQTLPDIELLGPLSAVFGVTSDYLIGTAQKEIRSDIIKTYEIDRDASRLLTVLYDTMERDDYYKAAKLLEDGELDFIFKVELNIKNNEDSQKYIKNIPVERLNDDTLNEISNPLSELLHKAFNKSDDALKRILPFLRCPQCGFDLKYIKSGGREEENKLICEKGHEYRIIDGIVDFDMREQVGNDWSWCYKTYSDYLEIKNAIELNRKKEGGGIIKEEFDEIRKSKPEVILEAGTGEGSWASYMLENISWPCTVIFTDLSYRILKYDKKYFEENNYNPNVKIVYLACDIRNLPLKDNMLQCIASFAGFTNMEGFEYIEGINQAARVLKYGGECVYDACFVSDKNDSPASKWIYLMRDSKEGYIKNAPDYICDLAEWRNINKDIGFTSYDIRIIKDEAKAPDTDRFPYINCILQWMGTALICAKK